ncbi:hypothetical protein PYW07_010141 [Mythimna separata]|uniref:Uncharacterized protein n=1 Tax=Mythimna separata TaxID=271217 RepID=A0AAD7YHK2_MYTSE|nr:hypothetical protein PYW07_010141 [Mythimna separata]
MACTRPRREKSPPPIASTRTRRCSAQARHTSTVSSGWSSPGRPFLLDSMQEPPVLTVSPETRREREDAVTSFQPLLKEGTHRRNDGVPSTGLRQSQSPCHPEVPPGLCPPYYDLSRQRSFAPAVHLHTQIVHTCKASRSHGGRPARRLAASREIVRYLSTVRMAMTLWQAFSLAAGRIPSDGAQIGAP